MENNVNNLNNSNNMWSQEKIDELNWRQENAPVKPLTCDRSAIECEVTLSPSTCEGVLIATENGWVCPCGKFKQ